MKKRTQTKKAKAKKVTAKKKITAKSKKTTTKKSVASKAKPKKASPQKSTRTKPTKKIPLIAPSEFLPQTPPNPSKKPGHRTLNLKDNFQERSGPKTHTQESANQYMSRAEQIRRTSRTNRRVITGAAIGKTGRITTEKV